MYILGHLALGYFFSKPLKYFGYKINYLYIAFFSLLPDIDFLIPSITHRGPTHSITAILVMMIASLIIRKLLPYFFAFSSHILVGDLLTANGVKLLWPISRKDYVIHTIFITGQNQMFVEVILFLLAILVFFITKDYKQT